MMHDTHAPPSPTLFFDTVNAYQRTACLKAAIELDLFTAIGEGFQTAAELGEKIGAPERGTRILCDYLTAIGFLTKSEGVYELTHDSAVFLDKSSPAYAGGALEFLASTQLTDGFKDIAAAVRRGGTALDADGVLAPEHPVWVRFARAMAPMIAPQARALAEIVARDFPREATILDVAAGHGLFGIEVALRNPKSRIVGLDWPNVLQVALENAKASGVADRYSVIRGSAFEVDLGGGYDAVLLPNILHHFDVPTCESLLGKVRKSLKPGGRAYTVEFVPNEDRVTPREVATFSMMMLGTTPGGDAYTYSDLDLMLRSSGFPENRLVPLPPSIQHVVISKC